MVDTPSSTAPTAGTAEKPVPVYCQKYMNNLCFLRSCDDPSDDEENDENDKSDVGAISSYHPRRTRCQFLHDAAFRRMFLARAHYTHTKYSQTHSDPPSSSVSSSHRGGRCSGRGGQHPPSTATDSDTPPVDGKLAGLKPPVAESALLRKVGIEQHLFGGAIMMTHRCSMIQLTPLFSLLPLLCWLFGVYLFVLCSSSPVVVVLTRLGYFNRFGLWSNGIFSPRKEKPNVSYNNKRKRNIRDRNERRKRRKELKRKEKRPRLPLHKRRNELNVNSTTLCRSINTHCLLLESPKKFSSGLEHANKEQCVPAAKPKVEFQTHSRCSSRI